MKWWSELRKQARESRQRVADAEQAHQAAQRNQTAVQRDILPRVDRITESLQRLGDADRVRSAVDAAVRGRR